MAAPGHGRFAPTGGRTDPNNGSIVLLLSLFLLLLVFFIVLNAQSVQATHRVRAVMGSLERSFPAFFIDPRLRERTDPVASRAGTVFSVQWVEGVGKLFATAVAVAKVESVTPGRQLEVRLPADELFIPGTAELRPDRQGLIDRIAASLLDTRPGERIELDALLAIGITSTSSQAPGPVARAGALARLLVADGAPANAVTVGIERGDPGSVRFLFSLRASDDYTGPAGGGPVGGGRR
ncbi:hypothetical protein [Azospirillum sp. sgz302134]